MSALTRVAGLVCGLLALSSVNSFSRERTPSNGQITNLAFSYSYGTAPGLDQFDASGSYVLGTGNNGIHLPGEAVSVSFDGGHFTQTIPANSFVAISGGYSYTAPTGSSGVTFMKVMNNGTFQIQGRKLDLTSTQPSKMGVLSFVVGDDTFSATPNSPPVAKIAGPSAATVGAPVTLDGTQSTDFNGNSISYTWSIVSQPLGSAVSLSSTTNATTSFTPTYNGAYVIKLLPSDGIVAGTPALITITASGAAAPAPTPPGPDNGLFSIASNQGSYVVGNTATLTMHVAAPQGGGPNRWYFAATLNDQPIALSANAPNSNDYTFVTPAFTTAGTQVYKVDGYFENTNLAIVLGDSITSFNADIVKVNAALQYETDAARIAQLQAQKAYDLEQIANAQDQQAQNRTKVGQTDVLTFNVN